MAEAAYPLPSETTDTAIGRFLKEQYPHLDPAYYTTFLELVRNFELRSSPAVKIDDVYFVRRLCETIFRDTIIPEQHRRKKALGELQAPAEELDIT